ncbi:hypothetical protein [Actinomadura sp. NPDC049753]|uniref:hypothetical protein n=1 Tax=Actinomadura sp. NPDC049753 TaxID=3154739 RepID=UPI003415B810
MVHAPDVPAEEARLEAKARLEAEFPGWSFTYIDRGRWWQWWAIRGPLNGETLGASGLSDTNPEGIAHQIREVTRGQ